MSMKIPFIPEYVRYERKIRTVGNKQFQKRIILISDSHITDSDNGSFNSAMFRKALQEISRINNVDYVIHLGDLTQEGTYLDYQLATDMIHSIRNDRFYMIPGNHDARNVGYLIFEEIFGSRRFEIDDPNLYILGIDSSIPDQNGGHIGSNTIKKCQSEFLDHDEQVKLFCFHHQLIPIPFTGRERSAISDGGDALDMALKTNVDLILNGHRHYSNIYTCTDGDVDLSIFNCGTLSCNKTRYRELFTYNILDINEKMAKFTTKLLLDGTQIARARYINRVFTTQYPENDKKLCTFIHMGSTHFSNSNFDELIFDKAMFQISKLNPSVIIHTGSVTDQNRESDYEIALRKLAYFEKPLILLPGFKDLQKYVWELFPTKIGELNPTFENEYLRIVGINTIDPHISNGTVGRKRMREIISHFNSLPQDKFNILALNHRLIPPPKLKFDEILTDSGEVLKKFTDINNKIDFVLMGKNNVGFSLQLENTILSYCGSFSSKDVVELNKHTFNYVECYESGLVKLYEHIIETNESRVLGTYWVHQLAKLKPNE